MRKGDLLERLALDDVTGPLVEPNRRRPRVEDQLGDALRRKPSFGELQQPGADSSALPVRLHSHLPKAHCFSGQRSSHDAPNQPPALERPEMPLGLLGLYLLWRKPKAQRLPQKPLPQIDFFGVIGTTPSDFLELHIGTVHTLESNEGGRLMGEMRFHGGRDERTRVAFWRQVSIPVHSVSTNRLTAALCVPNDSFRQITA